MSGQMVNMDSHWFLCLPVCDVIVMSAEAGVDSILCLSHITLSALPHLIIILDFIPGLQVTIAHMRKAWLVVVLRKVVAIWIWLQVRQCLVPQGLLTLACWSLAGLHSELTQISRRFFDRR